MDNIAFMSRIAEITAGTAVVGIVANDDRLNDALKKSGDTEKALDPGSAWHAAGVAYRIMGIWRRTASADGWMIRTCT